MKTAFLKPTLTSVLLLSAAVSLASCAPAASEFGVGTSSAQTSNTQTSNTQTSSARTSAARAPRYPLKAGQVWSLSGYDQNRNTLRSKMTLSDKAPVYRSGSNGKGIWFYGADNGYIVLYELEQGTRFVVWDESDPERLVACYVPTTYSDSQGSYEGAALSGSDEQISDLFGKLGNSVFGGSCSATRG